MMSRKEHLTIEGLRKIVSIRATINNGLTDMIIKSLHSEGEIFIQWIVERPLITAP